MFCGTAKFHIVFPCITHIQSECGEYSGRLCEILLVPENIVMNLNNVMNK